MEEYFVVSNIKTDYTLKENQDCNLYCENELNIPLEFIKNVEYDEKALHIVLQDIYDDVCDKKWYVNLKKWYIY